MLRTAPWVILVVLVSGCTTGEESSLAVTAETSMATLNAENDVFGLVVRYHEAKRRADAYATTVQRAEARVTELEAQLSGLRPQVDAAEASVADAEARKQAAETAQAAATDAVTASTEKIAAANAAAETNATTLAELEAKRTQVDAAIAKVRSALDNGTKEAAALAKENERLEQRLNTLRDRVALLRSAQGGHEKQLADIEKSIESLLGKKDSR